MPHPYKLHTLASGAIVIGDGLLAQTLLKSKPPPDCLFIAAGISNSLTTDPAEEAREEAMIRQLTEDYPEKLFLYFGTCSQYDQSRQNSRYIQHKKAMEQMVAKQSRYLILRLPLVVGRSDNPNTLANFLHRKITGQEPFEVWQDAIRWVLDVEDAIKLAISFAGDERLHNKAWNITGQPVAVLPLVEAMEALLQQKGRHHLVHKGEPYAYPAEESIRKAKELGIHFAKGYYLQILQKYYGPRDHAGLTVR